jgi:hypothetical protein
MVAISHDAPTDWIKLPKDETKVAHQNRAKTRCSNGASVDERQRAKREEGSWDIVTARL